mgnify:CR=1 FL=1
MSRPNSAFDHEPRFPIGSEYRTPTMIIVGLTLVLLSAVTVIATPRSFPLFIIGIPVGWQLARISVRHLNWMTLSVMAGGTCCLTMIASMSSRHAIFALSGYYVVLISESLMYAVGSGLTRKEEP